MWTDSDDLLDRQNVDKKVNYMENHLDVGIVMCRGRKVLETNLNHKIEEYFRIPPKEKDDFFEDLLVSKNVVFTPGIYMVRRSVIEKAFPDRKNTGKSNWTKLSNVITNCLHSKVWIYK